jgi:hypothetical protein
VRGQTSPQALLAHISAQTTEADIWQRLHLANGHLTRLHGRYLLRRKQSGDLELDFVALDTLNGSGTMIGVISHVESLKERIPAQIRVEKGGSVGHSGLVV